MTAPTYTDQPPHLIGALEQLDDELAELDPSADAEPAPPARRQPGMLWFVELEDGSSFEVRSANRDVIAWERTRARHREWPSSSDAPIFATSFVVWSAARRAGLTALTFDQFSEACLDFTKLAEQPADPTR